MSAETDTILAIDLGRYKSVACVYDRATRAHTFRTIDTTPIDLDTLLGRHPTPLTVLPFDFVVFPPV
jgi:transposase